MTRSISFDAPEGEDMSQQGGLRRSAKFAMALLVAFVVVLGIAGLAHANDITVTNTAQLQNAFSSPSPCNAALGPCPDTTAGASNTIHLGVSTDAQNQYLPTSPLNIQANIAGT